MRTEWNTYCSSAHTPEGETVKVEEILHDAVHRFDADAVIQHLEPLVLDLRGGELHESRVRGERDGRSVGAWGGV